MKQKDNKDIYSKPNKLFSYMNEIKELQAKISNYEDKLFHLQNKMLATVTVDTGVASSPQFQKYAEKKERLEKERDNTQEKIYISLNAMLANFRNTKVENIDDVKDIYSLISFATNTVHNEVDKGAILSNVLSLHVSKEVENNLFNGVESIVDKDREFISGYLLHDENAPERKLEFFVPSHGLDKLFENSIRNRGTNRYNSGISKIILEDTGYTEKMFDRLGKESSKVVSLKGLTRKEKSYLKKQYHKYRIERANKPKLNSSFLKVTAAAPSGLGKLIYGTVSSVGKVFGFINKALSGVAFALALPFNATAKGLKKLSKKSAERSTYQDDQKDIYKNIKRALRKNGIGAKRLGSINVNVEKMDNEYVLHLSGSMQMKGKVECDYNVLYHIREGEYKNFKEIFRDKLRDDEDEIEENFVIGTHLNSPEFIRVMRRIAEVTNEEEALYVDSKEILESEEVERVNSLNQGDELDEL